MRIVMMIILVNDFKWKRWQQWQWRWQWRWQEQVTKWCINKKTMMRTFSPPDLSSHPPTEPSICAALDDVPIQRCSLRLSSYDDDKHEDNRLYIFTFPLFFHIVMLSWWQTWRLSLSTKSYFSNIHIPLPICSFTLSSYLCFLVITNHQPERKNLKDPQILLRDLQSVDVNLTAQYWLMESFSNVS